MAKNYEIPPGMKEGYRKKTSVIRLAPLETRQRSIFPAFLARRLAVGEISQDHANRLLEIFFEIQKFDSSIFTDRIIHRAMLDDPDRVIRAFDERRNLERNARARSFRKLIEDLKKGQEEFDL